ncbi:MAG: GNAT family N-acetyltransferase [Rhodobacteraceae bacterium]|nr:GNAT family N-acetyltransferase [Paracoccaceae bacterium]
MTALSIRPMTPEDVGETLALRARTRENAIDTEELAEVYGITPESAAEALRSVQAGWVCETEGRIVGFAIGDRSNGEVVVVAVLPDFEGRGVGRTLLTRVEEMLHAAGHDSIWLWANPDPAVRASGFYHHLGWRDSGIVEHGDARLEKLLWR